MDEEQAEGPGRRASARRRCCSPPACCCRACSATRARRCWPIGSAPAPSTDAYYAAFQIPDLLNYLLAGGALSIAFLPLYTEHLAAGDDAAADHLLATVLGTLTAVAAVATVRCGGSPSR